MGSASSRIVRRAVKPITSQPREPSSLSLDSTACNSHPIERDDQNAHFIANIRRLGPVSVDHHATRYAPVCLMALQYLYDSYVKCRFRHIVAKQPSSPLMHRLSRV